MGIVKYFFNSAIVELVKNMSRQEFRSWEEFRRHYPKLLEEYTDEILRKNIDVIRKIVGSVRRIRMHGTAIVAMCIKSSSKEITQWARDFGARPVLHCEPDEEYVAVWFGVPDPFLSRRDVAESIAESLLMHKAPGYE